MVLPLPEGLIGGNIVGQGIDNQRAPFGVDEKLVPGADPGREPRGIPDRRNAERTEHDCNMRKRAYLVEGDAQQAGYVEQGQIRRQEPLRNQHYRTGNALERPRPHVVYFEKVAKNAMVSIVDVRYARPQDVVGDF